MDTEAHDHALGCMIDSELETTFPMQPEPQAMFAPLDLLGRTIAPKLRPRSEPSTQIRATIATHMSEMRKGEGMRTLLFCVVVPGARLQQAGSLLAADRLYQETFG